MKNTILAIFILSLINFVTLAAETETQKKLELQQQVIDAQLKRKIMADEKLTNPYLKLTSDEQDQQKNNILSKLTLNLYLKAEIGQARLNREKDKLIDKRLKSKTATIYSFGVGGYVLDNTRIELDITVMHNMQLKNSRNNNNPLIKEDINITRKANIIPLMVNAYADIFELDRIKLFIGGSIGAAKIKEKINFNVKRMFLNIPLDSKNIFFSNKNITNFSYAANAGVTIDLTNRVHTDIKYSFKDCGKTKSKIVETIRFPGIRYRNHVVSAGLRVDL